MQKGERKKAERERGVAVPRVHVDAMACCEITAHAYVCYIHHAPPSMMVRISGFPVGILPAAIECTLCFPCQYAQQALLADADARVCSVSLFPMGTEQTRAGALISQGPLGPRVMYPKGVRPDLQNWD